MTLAVVPLPESGATCAAVVGGFPVPPTVAGVLGTDTARAVGSVVAGATGAVAVVVAWTITGVEVVAWPIMGVEVVA